MNKNIFIVSGDASGDKHAANLVRSIKSLSKDTYVSSVGGENLKIVSDHFLDDIVSFSAFGFLPIRQYFKLRKIFKKITLYWKERKPDKVILVDYYGFNIHIAREAYRQQIPVYYYISPQVWASRPGRVKKLSKFVNKMLVILPFEVDIYKKAGMDTAFVGHPLIDMVPAVDSNSFKSGYERPVIGLFPGSRQHIVDRHLKLLKEVKDIINKEIPSDFKIFGLRSLDYKNTDIPVFYEDTYDERKKLTLALSVSGTVSLENALLGVPMIVFYKLSQLNYLIARMVANVKYITMVNILEEKEVVPEFIQNEATPQNIAGAAINLLRNTEKLDYLKKKLISFRSRLGQNYVSIRAAKIILGIV
ncbi:MAG: lipid-A-disaccharide synthase [Elusimicrobia bacterium]|nr:lipid-A-disaccharide synthase [Candidatus Liberimonas magnetica]